MTAGIGKVLDSLYRMDPIRRSATIWVLLQALLWTVFAIGYLANPGAWNGGPAAEPAAGGRLAMFMHIITNNLIVIALIAGGNLFVRFGSATPGLLVLLLQGITIGWIAGANGFAVPFPSPAAANLQYLRVGLWETTAYALACAVTLPKSLLVAPSFPAREWTTVRSLKELHFARTEKWLGLFALAALVGAAIVETFYLTR
ncbi:MAG: hypothetical protein ACOX8W_10315 [bacterium]